MCDRMTPEVDIKPDVHVKDDAVNKTPRSKFTQPSFVQNSLTSTLPTASSDPSLTPPDLYRKPEQKPVNSPTKPGKRSPVKKETLKSNSAQKEGFNPTTKAMAYDWVMKALDNMNSSPGLKKDLAEELGVKPGNLINVSSRFQTCDSSVDVDEVFRRAGTTIGSENLPLLSFLSSFLCS